jgi:hypothetical protein
MGYKQFALGKTYESFIWEDKLESMSPMRVYKIGGATYTFFETAEWKNGSWLSSLDNKNYLTRLKELSAKYGEPKIKEHMHMLGYQKSCNDYK